MNPFEMVIAIVAIVTIGSIIRTKQMARFGGRPRSMRQMFRGGGNDDVDAIEGAEASRLRDEVKALKERIQVLERIATERIAVEKENSLAREIEQLRDR